MKTEKLAGQIRQYGAIYAEIRVVDDEGEYTVKNRVPIVGVAQSRKQQRAIMLDCGDSTDAPMSGLTLSDMLSSMPGNSIAYIRYRATGDEQQRGAERGYVIPIDAVWLGLDDASIYAVKENSRFKGIMSTDTQDSDAQVLDDIDTSQTHDGAGTSTENDAQPATTTVNAPFIADLFSSDLTAENPLINTSKSQRSVPTPSNETVAEDDAIEDASDTYLTDTGDMDEIDFEVLSQVLADDDDDDYSSTADHENEYEGSTDADTDDPEAIYDVEASEMNKSSLTATSDGNAVLLNEENKDDFSDFDDDFEDDFLSNDFEENGFINESHSNAMHASPDDDDQLELDLDDDMIAEDFAPQQSNSQQQQSNMNVGVDGNDFFDTDPFAADIDLGGSDNNIPVDENDLENLLITDAPEQMDTVEPEKPRKRLRIKRELIIANAEADKATAETRSVLDDIGDSEFDIDLDGDVSPDNGIQQPTFTDGTAQLPTNNANMDADGVEDEFDVDIDFADTDPQQPASLQQPAVSGRQQAPSNQPTRPAAQQQQPQIDASDAFAVDNGMDSFENIFPDAADDDSSFNRRTPQQANLPQVNNPVRTGMPANAQRNATDGIQKIPQQVQPMSPQQPAPYQVQAQAMPQNPYSLQRAMASPQTPTNTAVHSTRQQHPGNAPQTPQNQFYGSGNTGMNANANMQTNGARTPLVPQYGHQQMNMPARTNNRMPQSAGTPMPRTAQQPQRFHQQVPQQPMQPQQMAMNSNGSMGR